MHVWCVKNWRKFGNISKKIETFIVFRYFWFLFLFCYFVVKDEKLPSLHKLSPNGTKHEDIWINEEKIFSCLKIFLIFPIDPARGHVNHLRDFKKISQIANPGAYCTIKWRAFFAAPTNRKTKKIFLRNWVFHKTNTTSKRLVRSLS